MNILMITGDKNLLKPGTPAHARLELQKSQVGRLEVVLVVRGGLRAAFKKLLLLRTEHFDVVTVQDPFFRGVMAWYVAWHLGARINVQVHTDLAVQSLVRHILAQVVLRHADSVRVVSQKIKEQVVNMRVQAPVYVLPIYVDIERFRNVAREPHAQKILLWIGRFEPEKDPLYALEVLEEVRASSIDAKLIMLGTGSLESFLRQKAKNLSPYIEFPGWRDPAELLAQADVVLSTSKHESYGVSILEALAAGVPVVAPDVGVAKEAGALVASHEGLASAIMQVLAARMRGELKLPVLSKEAWAREWKNTL